MIKRCYGHYTIIPNMKTEKINVDKTTGEILDTFEIESIDYIPANECVNVYYAGCKIPSYFYIESLNDDFSIETKVSYGSKCITFYQYLSVIRHICDSDYYNKGA